MRREHAVTRLLLTVLLSALSAAAVSAQGRDQPAPALGAVLTPGTTAWITDSSGREEQVRIAGVSNDIVTATAADSSSRRFRTADIARIRVRQPDSLLNGALIGAGVGVVSELGICSLMETWDTCRDDGGPMLAFGGLGAIAGLAIDALIHRRRTVYERGPGAVQLHVAPVIGVRATGVRFSVRF